MRCIVVEGNMIFKADAMKKIGQCMTAAIIQLFFKDSGASPRIVIHIEKADVNWTESRSLTRENWFPG